MTRKITNPRSQIQPPLVPEEYDSLVYFCGCIPDTLEYRIALNTAVTSITKWLAFAETGDNRGARTAQVLRDVLLPSFEIGEDMCGCSGGMSQQQTDCLCRIENLLNVMISIDNPVPVIPPDAPGENVPGVDPQEPELLAKRDAIICETSQILMAAIFQNVRLAKISECEGGDFLQDTAAFAESAGETSMNFYLAGVGIALALGAAAWVPVLGAAALTTGLIASAAKVVQWNPGGIFDPCTTPGQEPPEILEAYYCQLYTAIIKEYNFASFRDAMALQNDTAIAYYQAEGNTLAEAITIDADNREVFSNYLRQADLFKMFTLTLGQIVEDPYIQPSQCEECIDCDSATPALQIIDFGDPLIQTISPVPDVIVQSDRLAWSTFPSEVVISFTRPVCIQRFKYLLKRVSGQSTVPNSFIWFVGLNNYTSSVGGFGDNDENEPLGGYARELRISPGNSASASANLDIQLFAGDDGIYIRDVNP